MAWCSISIKTRISTRYFRTSGNFVKNTPEERKVIMLLYINIKRPYILVAIIAQRFTEFGLISVKIIAICNNKATLMISVYFIAI